MEKNQKPKIFTVLKIVAPIMLILGVVLIILGTAVFPLTWGSSSVAPNAALFAPGMIIAFLSIPCFFIAFMPNINKTMIKTAKYIQEDNKEDLTDLADTTADITSGAITKTTRAVKKGLTDTKYCRHCGEQIEADSKFCKHCGNEQ